MTKHYGYRIEWTQFVPGGDHSRECSAIRGDLESVREFLDSQDILAKDPIVVVEHTESDGTGRIVPTSEWDICED